MNLELEAAGALTTATLAASEIEGANSHRPSSDHAPANCANCAAPLTGPFCHACGQRAHVHRSLLHLGEEVLHGLLHFDAKAWRTLPMLVAKPGKLTRDYIDGKRTRFVSPLALFLFMMFLMFFAVSSVTVTPANTMPGQVAAATADLEKDIAKAKIKLAKAEAKLSAARANEESASAAQAEAEGARSEVHQNEVALKTFTAAVATKDGVNADGTPVYSGSVTTGIARLDGKIKQAIKNPEFTLYKIKNAASKFSFLLVPLSLPFLWLMFFWKRGVTMYDHAVFALYSLSFMALLVAVLTLLEKTGLEHAGGMAGLRGAAAAHVPATARHLLARHQIDAVAHAGADGRFADRADSVPAADPVPERDVMLRIRAEDPGTPDAAALIEELSAALAAITGDSGKSSFDADDVGSQASRFAVARDRTTALQWAAARFRPLADGVAELKRMYARPGNPGAGSALLAFLEAEAAALEYRAIWLSTRVRQ